MHIKHLLTMVPFMIQSRSGVHNFDILFDQSSMQTFDQSPNCWRLSKMTIIVSSGQLQFAYISGI